MINVNRQQQQRCSSHIIISENSNNSNNNNNNNNMDELSIDSETNEKVAHNGTKQVVATTNKATTRPQVSQKPHFRIDWRELTYYQKQSSFMSRLFDSGSAKSKTLSAGQLTSNAANIGKQPPEPKRILNSLDGSFKSGELSAILGPSGAGKSTFLSTLFGAKQEGAYGQTKVTWFGESQQTSRMRRYIKIAQLPQHDHLLHHLTVYETLMFASKIKNATKSVTGKNFHRQNVKRVAKMLKLSDCLDTRCGKLSGGQYKRVSIGQELLSEPDVIILDEPTSGLDAMTCLTTIQTLKSIVMKHPMSIILTIHQPDMDVFNLFDHVYVIAQGGLAIYEGPPSGIIPTLAEANLRPPVANYNPARFIVEHAFLMDPPDLPLTKNSANAGQQQCAANGTGGDSYSTSSNSDSSGEDDQDDDDDELEKPAQNYLKRSVLSLTEAISGREAVSGKVRQRDRKPLLNIGFQTLGGKLITGQDLTAAEKKNHIQQTERWNLLKRLNQIQKARYNREEFYIAHSDISSDGGAQSPQRDDEDDDDDDDDDDDGKDEGNIREAVAEAKAVTYERQSLAADTVLKVDDEEAKSSAKSDYSSSGWLDQRAADADRNSGCSYSTNRHHHHHHHQPHLAPSKATSMSQLATPDQGKQPARLLSGGRSLQMVNSPTVSDQESVISEEAEEFVVNFPDDTTGAGGGCAEGGGEEGTVGSAINGDYNGNMSSGVSTGTARTTVTATCLTPGGANCRQRIRPLKRQFDKRLSAKHNCSKQDDYPIYYHAFLLTHRTWLSIVRDPIFFGIQAIMHTTIPLLLAIIFGSVQEEGCPRVGNFDLVKFAYSDSDNLIQGTMTSIRQSIGNIGINFFEIFVLCFSINCITALVFPSDMHVLLKEYRNGWYALRSYFFGRTLADLPVPVVLHSIGISILYFMTGQPHSPTRFGAIIALVILSSLISQSVGLTIGALLMKSSQSAVLAAAAIVSPFFALSGFIVRIHTLPWGVQLFAKASYLYHLLNGFIILRYGYGRCECQPDDFEANSEHQIPSNLHTMASIWIGTYSDEYSQSQAVQAINANAINNNRTNVDPNIDVVDKMMNAFKMANSYGHEIQTCDDVLPYAMIDFNLRDHDIYNCFLVLILMVIATRFITFVAIYYKIRSFA